MYQATGSSSSWANTAMPRPHRRPVHSAQPAASTAEPITANQAAVPYPLMPARRCRQLAHHSTSRHDRRREALERHHDGGLTHGCR